MVEGLEPPLKSIHSPRNRSISVKLHQLLVQLRNQSVITVLDGLLHPPLQLVNWIRCLRLMFGLVRILVRIVPKLVQSLPILFAQLVRFLLQNIQEVVQLVQRHLRFVAPPIVSKIRLFDLVHGQPKRGGIRLGTVSPLLQLGKARALP